MKVAYHSQSSYYIASRPLQYVIFPNLATDSYRQITAIEQDRYVGAARTLFRNSQTTNFAMVIRKFVSRICEQKDRMNSTKASG